MSNKLETLAVWLVSLSVAVGYTAACAVPAVYIDEGGGYACTTIRLGSPIGLEVLLIGWMPIFTIPTWSANVLLVAGLVCMWRRKFKAAVYFGGIGVLLGLTTWIYVAFGWRVLSGYYYWQASLIAFFLGAAVLSLSASRQRAAVSTREALSIVDAEPMKD